ncbi:MAG: zf-HC2 domain-containing protein [Acidobacteriota bacterium]
MKDDHKRIIELLPWFVSGALSSGQSEQVEAHLTTCADCRREIEELNMIHSAVADSNEEILPSPRLASRVIDRIDEYEEERSRPGTKKLFARLRAWKLASPQLALAQSLMLIILASALGVFIARAGRYQSLFDQEKQRANINEKLLAEERKLLAEERNKLRTLSGASSGNISSEKTARINVAFQDRATEKAIRELLISLKAVIAHGPSALGIYIIAVPVAEGQDNRAESAVERLRSRPDLVRFAEAQPR